MSKVIADPPNELRHVASYFDSGSSAEQEAQTVAGNLVLANLSGHDSHGVGMVPRYVDAVLEGGLQAQRRRAGRAGHRHPAHAGRPARLRPGGGRTGHALGMAGQGSTAAAS
jgi:LDH2 family malate/lactate/ureidoglycolate dehydrogenase